MTTYDLTLCPNAATISLLANTALYPSPLIGSAQTVDRQGLKWKIAYTFNNLTTADRAELMALLASLRGQANRIRVPVWDNPAQGLYGGTPVVDGGSQTGNTLDVTGLTTGVTGWIRAGDYFSVVVNGEVELKMATLDADSDGSGDSTITFTPNLRDSPTNGAAVYVEDGTLAVPSGVFLLESPESGWSSRPWIDGPISSFSMSMVEDVFASQA